MYRPEFKPDYDPEKIKLSHSYSAISTYDKCPRWYYYERISKEVKDEGNEYTRYGERVREALYKRVCKGEPLNDEFKQWKPICNKITGKYAKSKIEGKLRLCLDKDFKPVDWDSDNAWMRGIIDLLIVTDDKVNIFSWKTGKRRPDFLQMTIYSLLIFEHCNHKQFMDSWTIDNIDARFMWLKTKKIDTEKYSKEDVDSMWSKVLEHVGNIEHSLEKKYWPAYPSGLCRWCPAKNICPDASELPPSIGLV